MPADSSGRSKAVLGGAGRTDKDNGCWDEHRRLVLHELERLHDRDIALSKKIDSLSSAMSSRIEILTKTQIAARMDIASLKSRAGFFGVVGGMIPVLIMLALALLTRFL